MNILKNLVEKVKKNFSYNSFENKEYLSISDLKKSLRILSFSMIPYGRQSIGRQEIKNLNKVLRSNWLTQGPLVEKFERDL